MPRFKRTPVAVLADARSVRASELARRNRHNRNAAAPRLPNRSSRGWHQAPGIGANRTAGARGARGAWVASAWAASGWDGDRVSSRPLLAKEVRLVLSSSVAHYETAVRAAGRAKPVPPAAGEHGRTRPRPAPPRPHSPTRPSPTPRSTHPTHCLPPTSRSLALASRRPWTPSSPTGWRGRCPARTPCSTTTTRVPSRCCRRSGMGCRI